MLSPQSWPRLLSWYVARRYFHSSLNFSGSTQAWFARFVLLAQSSSSGTLMTINKVDCDLYITKIPLRAFSLAEARVQLTKYTAAGKYKQIHPSECGQGNSLGQGRVTMKGKEHGF